MKGYNHVICVADNDLYLSLFRRIAMDVGFSASIAKSFDDFVFCYGLVWPSVVVLDLYWGPKVTFETIEFLGREGYPGRLVLAGAYNQRILDSSVGFARDNGLTVFGTVEKRNARIKLTALLSSAYVGDLPHDLRKPNAGQTGSGAF